MIARLGLFVAVVAWVVGQRFQGGWSAYCMFGTIDQTGVLIAIGTQTPLGMVSPDGKMAEDFLNGFIRTAEWHFSLHYIAISISAGTQCIAINHRLVVTIFALFYGVLKWVYRKRGKDTATDE